MASTVAVDNAPAPTRRRAYRPATFLDAVHSEWTKLRSVRSTYWALIVAAILGIGIGALISGVSAHHYATDPPVRQNWNPADRSLRSLAIAQLAFAILGVMVVSGEYSTGMIRTSLAAVPKRARFLAAKALVWGPVALVAGEIISFVTFLVGQALISGNAPSTTLGGHDVLRAVVGAGLYLAVLGVLGSALGVLAAARRGRHREHRGHSAGAARYRRRPARRRGRMRSSGGGLPTPASRWPSSFATPTRCRPGLGSGSWWCSRRSCWRPPSWCLSGGTPDLLDARSGRGRVTEPTVIVVRHGETAWSRSVSTPAGPSWT